MWPLQSGDDDGGGHFLRLNNFRSCVGAEVELQLQRRGASLSSLWSYRAWTLRKCWPDAEMMGGRFRCPREASRRIGALGLLTSGACGDRNGPPKSEKNTGGHFLANQNSRGR